MSSVDIAKNLRQLVTFRLGEMTLGIDVAEVLEINRRTDCHGVPHAPEFVRGLISLRGEMVTLIDARCRLGLPRVEPTEDTRNLILRSQGEMIGLTVDQVTDLAQVDRAQVLPPPVNSHMVDGRFCSGVVQRESDLVVILDLDWLVGETCTEATTS